MTRPLLAAGLAALLLLVGAPAGADQPAEGRLRLLSYNVHGLPAFITGDDTLGRQRAIRPLLEPFDVVALQEDWMEDGHDLLTRECTHPQRDRFTDALDGRAYGSGLSVLSRARIVKRFTEHYRTFFGVLDHANDGLASKGFLMVRLELAPGAEVDLYDSHLDAGGAEGDAQARAEQVEQLVASMAGVSAGRAVVFLGDTNLDDSGKDAATMKGWLERAGLTCACRSTQARCCGRIDRILARSGAGVDLTAVGWGVAKGFVDAKGGPLSDHEPIEATLRWTRRAL